MKRDKRMYGAVWLLFIISVVVRGLILSGPHVMSTYYDELLYWGIAKTFWTEPAFTLFHTPIGFSKFVYSMVLSPLFLIKDSAVRAASAGWLNTVLISFSVFPAYRLARKITSSRKIQLISLLLFLVSPIMNYANKYAPECMYLPLSLYLVLDYYTLLERSSTGEAKGQGRLLLQAALLGVLAYISYVEKEASSAFIAAFLILVVVKTIKTARAKDEKWKTFLLIFAVHTGAIVICHLGLTLLFPLQFSYSDQTSWNNIRTMYRVEYLIHSVVSNGLYINVAFFGLPALCWLLRKKDQEEEGERDFFFFLYTAFGLTLFFISYSISLPEELGRVNQRLHTRYYIPFLLPFFALALEKIRTCGQKSDAWMVKTVLVIGVASVLLLTPNRYVSAYDSFDTWHIQDANTFFDDLHKEEIPAEDQGIIITVKKFLQDQTAGSKEITYNHGLIFVLCLFTLFTAIVAWLLKKHQKMAVGILLGVILLIEGYNNYVSVQRIAKYGTISETEARAYAQLDQDVSEIVGDKNLLVINNEKLENQKRKSETFLSMDYYSALTSGINKVMASNGFIKLQEAEIPISMTMFTQQSKYPKGTTFDYVLCTKDVKFSEDTVIQVFYSEGTGYYLYQVVDPEYLDVDYLKGLYEESSGAVE
ncbi:MAG: hypothetical protein IJ153_07590 [Clostridia bacterium]|nr:hypothetical protein [Clostridia bacterium]